MTKHREDLHFMKKIIILITVFSLFLGACNTDNSTEHKNDKAENKNKVRSVFDLFFDPMDNLLSGRKSRLFTSLKTSSHGGDTPATCS